MMNSLSFEASLVERTPIQKTRFHSGAIQKDAFPLCFFMLQRTAFKRHASARTQHPKNALPYCFFARSAHLIKRHVSTGAQRKNKAFQHAAMQKTASALRIYKTMRFHSGASSQNAFQHAAFQRPLQRSAFIKRYVSTKAQRLKMRFSTRQV